MLPVMIATLVGVLEGVQVLPGAFWAAGAAVALASVWTSFRLRGRIAEIRVDGEWVYVRSIDDVLAGSRRSGRKVLDVRPYGSWAYVTVGLTMFELDRECWPEFDRLIEALILSRGGSLRGGRS